MRRSDSTAAIVTQIMRIDSGQPEVRWRIGGARPSHGRLVINSHCRPLSPPPGTGAGCSELAMAPGLARGPGPWASLAHRNGQRLRWVRLPHSHCDRDRPGLAKVPVTVNCAAATSPPRRSGVTTVNRARSLSPTAPPGLTPGPGSAGESP